MHDSCSCIPIRCSYSVSSASRLHSLACQVEMPLGPVASQSPTPSSPILISKEHPNVLLCAVFVGIPLSYLIPRSSVLASNVTRLSPVATLTSDADCPPTWIRRADWPGIQTPRKIHRTHTLWRCEQLSDAYFLQLMVLCRSLTSQTSPPQLRVQITYARPF